MSSLNPQHQGIDGLEQRFHECSHLMMDTVDATLKARAKAVGKDLSREVSHTILFYTVADTVWTLIPDHVPYPDQVFHTRVLHGGAILSSWSGSPSARKTSLPNRSMPSGHYLGGRLPMTTA